jgi:hypothetical protein
MADSPPVAAGDPAQAATKSKPTPAPTAPVVAPLDPRAAKWLHDHIVNGPIARDTVCWNTLVEALPALVDALKA